jgi:hypothetical protein
MAFTQITHLDGQHGSSSVALFQANNGNPVMRFSNATHVCVLNNTSTGVEDDDDDVECAFAVVRLIDSGRRLSSADGDCENDDMFTDISMDASASAQSIVSVTALLVMHDLAVPTMHPAAAAATSLPSSTLPIPKVLPAASCKYVFSHNSRLKQGREASFCPSHCLFHCPFPLFAFSCAQFLCLATVVSIRLLQAVKRALAATLSSSARALSSDALHESDPQRLQPVLIPPKKCTGLFQFISPPLNSWYLASCSARCCLRSLMSMAHVASRKMI